METSVISLEDFVNNIVQTDQPFALLNLCIDDVQSIDIINQYVPHIMKHNEAMNLDPHPNSGFDLFVPENTTFNVPFQTTMVDHQVMGEMFYFSPHFQEYTPSAFYLYPRSSLSKTPLMLANHVGVIDSGYRGHLIGAFRYLPVDPNLNYYAVEQSTRLLQVCHPSLCRVYVRLTEKEEFTETVRGEGGFGSTNLST